jgi:hypothetical protein
MEDPGMAKQPKFYPNLPRMWRSKDAKRVGAILVNTPVLTSKVFRADRWQKAFGIYSPNWISVTTTENQGSDTRSGTKNPNWRVTIASGGDATSSYSRTLFKLKPTSYNIYSEDPLSWSRGSGQMFGGMLTFQPDYTVLKDQAIGRLKHKLRSKVGNAQLGPPIAESREIHRLVRQINGLGMSTFRALLAAKKSGGKSVAKQFGNIWLGFGFGVNPLLQDIKSAADSILEYITREDRRIVVTASISRDYNSMKDNAVSSSDYISAHSSLGWFLSSNHVQGIRYVAGVNINVRAGSNYSMPDHLGLKIEALPSILWELTPYSWALDYFSTVGSWLDDVFYTLPVTVIYLSESYKYQCRTVATPKAINISGATSTLSGNPSVGVYTAFTRTKLAPTLPTRSLRIKTVDEIANHGLTKLLNLGSVIAGRHGPSLDAGAFRPAIRRTRASRSKSGQYL